MRVIVANFGAENYFWPECRQNDLIATFEEKDLYDLWEAGRKDAFIAECMRRSMTADGKRPTKAVATRWYNVTSIVSESSGDLWLHLDRDGLWWTHSKPDRPTITLEPSDNAADSGRLLLAIRKPAQRWNNFNRKGFRLDPGTLHKKAKDILSIPSALQEPSPDNAAYLKALINGENLSEWENSAKFRACESKGPSKGEVMSPLQVTIRRMAQTAFNTAAGANGQLVTTAAKVKNIEFDDERELIDYLDFLWNEQAGICAISGLPLGIDYNQPDENMLASLDRIDSNGHYEKGNLQVVCRFINRWKGAADDAEFRRLLDCVRSA